MNNPNYLLLTEQQCQTTVTNTQSTQKQQCIIQNEHPHSITSHEIQESYYKDDHTMHQYVSASHDIVLSQSWTRVKLNRVFCVRFLVSPNFPMFPWEYMDGIWPTKSEGAGLIVPAINFQPIRSQSTDVMDGQTDVMRSQYRAMHYRASRGKNVIIRGER